MMEEELTEAEALQAIARSLRLLGNADAGTSMGAIEALGLVIKESQEIMASAIEGAGYQIAEALRDLAAALEKKP